MEVKYVIAGRLRRDTLLPTSGKVLIDVPGGHLLQAAAGLSVWEQGCGLLARAGEDYPHAWLEAFNQRGWDTRGVRILPKAIDQRYFQAMLDAKTVQRDNPVAHFARLGLPFPRSLLGYKSPAAEPDPLVVPEDAPRITDIPPEYLEAKALLLCRLDLTSANRISSAFKQAGTATLTLAPCPGLMKPEHLEKTATMVRGLTAFLPSEQDLRSLFPKKAGDIWEMAAAAAGFGCEFVVIRRGDLGQCLYDPSGHRRWEIPAYPARLVDLTGAGDAFCGGFLAGYVTTFDPLRAVLHGSVSASLAVEGSGVFHALEALPGLAARRLESLENAVRQV